MGHGASSHRQRGRANAPYVLEAPAAELADVDVEARIAAAIAARRPLIAELVRQAVDRELVAILEVGGALAAVG